jgi:hypothetical protein
VLFALLAVAVFGRRRWRIAAALVLLTTLTGAVIWATAATTTAAPISPA